MHIQQTQKQIKAIKITSCFGLYKTIYHNGSYVLLFGKTMAKF